MTISSDKFKVLQYGKELDWNQEVLKIIGTIGTDLLEKRIIRLNFKEGYGLFDVNENQDGLSTLEFEKRRQLIPSK
jgi:hypothetical protein